MNSTGDNTLLSSCSTFLKVTRGDLLSLFCHVTFCYFERHLRTHTIPKATSETTYLVVLLAWRNTETSCCHVGASNGFYFLHTTKFRF